jgi:hypothetical protein
MTEFARDGLRWRREEDEAIVDVYIAHGRGGGGTAVLRPLAARLGRSEASVRMRLANVRAVVEGGGLGNVAKQTRDVAKAKGLV